MALQHTLAITGLLLLTAPTAAQGGRWENIDSAGIKFWASGRLERLPMKLGPQNLYQRARFRPQAGKDYINAAYVWYCDVYEFHKQVPTAEDGEDARQKELRQKLSKLLGAAGSSRHTSFADWLEGQKKQRRRSPQKIEISVRGKPEKARGSRLPYKHWVWLRKGRAFRPNGVQYCEAAVYEFPNREVALVVEMPLVKRKKNKPHGKWARFVKKMIESGSLLKPRESSGPSSKEVSKDKYADTEHKRKALAAAKKNIQSLRGWDYFTTPHYIVLFAWDWKKTDKRAAAERDARDYSAKLERMREFYIQYYPLDATGTKAIMPDPNSIPDADSGKGPITPGRGAAKDKDKDKADAEKAIQNPTRKAVDAASDKEGAAIRPAPYPVFRLCATYAQFHKYGGTGGGVIGWFNPKSKELVVFLGGDKMMYKGATETVVYHEGWHQYADLYFPKRGLAGNGTLHRWFDEGHGDYFGSFRWRRGKWSYRGSKMRYASCKQMVRKGDYVPFKEIVSWSRRKFYSGRAAYYYAQAYSMIDYLRRGQKLKKLWDPRYGQVLDMYRKVMLVGGDRSRAVKTAFRGFDDEDWKKLEEAWKAWVDSPNFKSGK